MDVKLLCKEKLQEGNCGINTSLVSGHDKFVSDVGAASLADKPFVGLRLHILTHTTHKQNTPPLTTCNRLTAPSLIPQHLASSLEKLLVS